MPEIIMDLIEAVPFTPTLLDTVAVQDTPAFVVDNTPTVVPVADSDCQDENQQLLDTVAQQAAKI